MACYLRIARTDHGRQLGRIDVYWFSDKGGIQLPNASRLLYWDGAAFVPVKNPVGLGVEGDRYNTTTFDEVTTSKLKLEFDSGKASTLNSKEESRDL